MKQFRDIAKNLKKICKNIVLDEDNISKKHYLLDQCIHEEFKFQLNLEFAHGDSRDFNCVEKIGLLVSVEEYAFCISYNQISQKFKKSLAGPP